MNFVDVHTLHVVDPGRQSNYQLNMSSNVKAAPSQIHQTVG